MARNRVPRALLVAATLLLVAGPGAAIAQDQRAAGTTRLSDQVQLDRLIDLAATRLGLDVQYEPRELQNVTITVRLQRPLDDEELWALANELLVNSGFTTVQTPGSRLISVTRLNEAPQQARMETGAGIATPAGFVTILTEMQHVDPKQAVASLRSLSSKPGGSIVPIGETGLLMVSDVRPRLEQILELMERIDVPVEAPVLESIPVSYVAADQLVGVLTAAVNAIGAIQGRTLKGKVLPSTEGDAVILIAPPSEASQWRELVTRFDERQPVERRTYAPRYFPVEDVAPLLEAVAREPGPRGAGEQWQIITNDLTGTLIVTATPAEHEQIAGLIERLDDVPQAAQRPVRTFPIRNRSVHEVLDILVGLIEAGVLESARSDRAAEERPPAQRTTREVLPPDGAPGLPAPQQQPTAPARDARAAPQPEAGFGFGFEAALTLTADDATNTLIAVGDPRRLAQLEALIRTLDVRQPQVMIEVLVLSLNDSDELDLGVELEKMEVSGSTMINLASLFGLGTAGLENIPSPTGAGGTALVLKPGDFRILVRALESINEGRALNIPKVLVNNNQQATLDSVLQQPFTSTNASDTIATTSFGGTQDAGTTVTVTPRIAEGDHLVLEFQVALSSFVGQSSDPNIPPPRQQNNIESVATIPDGYTVVVGGLDTTNDAEAISQVPLLGSLPLIGEVFKNRSVSRTRTRFYVFMRVNIMRHRGFEDLKYASDVDVGEVGIDDGWPDVEPRLIK